MRNGEITTIVLHAIGGPRCTDDEVEFTGAPGDAKRWVGYFERQTKQEKIAGM